MAEKCLRCFRSVETCYCKYITPVKTGVTFVFLMHPKEAYRQRTGTGRLAHLSLTDSRIIVGVDFTQNESLNALLADNRYFPVLLYPGEDAFTAETIAAKMKECTSALDCVQGEDETAARTVEQRGAERDSTNALYIEEKCPKKTLLVVVVDATWFFAKKMLRLSPNVRALPKLSFKSGYISRYQFKTQPSAECLSTIESCYYLIRELCACGACADVDPTPLMDVFLRMVDFQLLSEEKRKESGEVDRYSRSGTIRARKKEKREQKENATNAESEKPAP